MSKKIYLVETYRTSFLDRLKGRSCMMLTLGNVDNSKDFHRIAIRDGDLIQIDSSNHPAIIHATKPEEN